MLYLQLGIDNQEWINLTMADESFNLKQDYCMVVLGPENADSSSEIVSADLLHVGFPCLRSYAPTTESDTSR